MRPYCAAATLDATLPGIDANDPSKTLGTIRLYSAVVSNMSCLADPGMDGASEEFPFMWSAWIPILFQRFFTFFENVDPGNAGKADGADKHRGGAGGDGGASYLMGASSMYSPLMRLIFARMHPSLRLGAVKQVAQFVLTSTHSGQTGEVGQMVMAAVTQAPAEAVPHLTRPLLDALAAEVDDVARLVADNQGGLLSADQIVSPTKEAKLKWQTGLLGAGMHYGGLRIVGLSADIRSVLRKLFEICNTGKSLRMGEMGAHVCSLLCGAMTGTYINDLFEADEVGGGSGDLPAKWVASKVKGAGDNNAAAAAAAAAAAGGEEGNGNGEGGGGGDAMLLPRTFRWRRPAAEELAVARELSAEFLEAPAKALLEAFGGGGGDGASAAAGSEPGLNKEKVRALLACMGGVTSGLRTRMAGRCAS